MPRWKDLPEDLDPQIKEFTSQLRRLVDRGDLSIAALADSTGYSKTSWERYLGGRLLAPKGAVVALAEVTGTSPVHLTTMWELAERAWSRAEMRQDRTMEAIRISQARAALGEFGAAEATGGPSARDDGATTAPAPTASTAAPPAVPAQPTAADADAREDAAPEPADGEDTGPDAAPRVNSWGLAGYRGPSPASARPGSATRPRPGTGAADGAGTTAAGAGGGTGGGRTGGGGTGGGAGARPSASPDGHGWAPAAPNSHDGQPRDPRPAGGPPAKGTGGRQRLTVVLAGLVGVLVVIAAVFVLVNRGDGEKASAAKSPSPAASTQASPPPGVKCAGSACDGKDAEAMKCSGDGVTTARSATVGAVTLEVRYSRICGTAWGRITGAAPGDKVELSAGKARQTGEITAAGDTIAYTPMVAVKDAAQANACTTLASGQTGCTR
ncbi:hypothetical protein GCM10010503_02430 [Streptomyces lucensis JCM 4490]|uniref:HTH cro/C1-type domain-containing protein n=1 Tax=Streptomyces lucensis JCM 4490 TaxID=1306176 RepID=A0A918MIX2_9ACTN|nr:XRE family transcriptional regulator [Streptomyces lucensis]GGW30373.1 hypothetical protein GCM10010503_02430 [Streptomyces lucensis JCM 4490]